jgi:hypothetical protein
MRLELKFENEKPVKIPDRHENRLNQYIFFYDQITYLTYISVCNSLFNVPLTPFLNIKA